MSAKSIAFCHAIRSRKLCILGMRRRSQVSIPSSPIPLIPRPIPNPQSLIPCPVTWYRSLYWRIALGVVGFLAAMLIVQAILFVWACRSRGDRCRDSRRRGSG